MLARPSSGDLVHMKAVQGCPPWSSVLKLKTDVELGPRKTTHERVGKTLNPIRVSTMMVGSTLVS